jgi:hypothetical protein
LERISSIHCRSGFHDGRVATLPDVVDHYDTQFHLNLSSAHMTPRESPT